MGIYKILKIVSFMALCMILLLSGCSLKNPSVTSKTKKTNDNGKIQFSKPTGVYKQGQAITINGTAKGTVHYTLDGSTPTKKSPVYSKPLTLKKTTVMQAAVFNEKGPEDTITATYIVGAPPSLPAFSIITEPDNLWSQKKGIYILGNHASGKYPYEGANYWQDWAIPVELNYIENGKSAYNVKADLKIFGGETRTLPQRSFALYAKKKYGSKSFQFPLFPDKKLNEYKTFVLRNGGQDFNRTHMLDGLVSTLAQGTNIDAQDYRPVVVYLNGSYWGIYDLREKIDTSFLAANHSGVTKKDIDLLESNAIVKEGSSKDYLNLIDFIKNNNLSNPDNYQEVAKQIDFNNFIDYITTELYIGNTDWPSHNYRYWKAGGSFSKWRWIIYDSDLSYGDAKENTVERLMNFKGKGDDTLYISYLFRELMKNNQFREDFKNRADYLLSHNFKPDQVIGTIDKLSKQLTPEMPTHIKKWGGTMAEWEKNVNSLKEFANYRPQYLKEDLNKLFNTFQ